METSLKKVLIIAEAGVNHNGCLETAKALVIKAKECGADAIKFQTFKAEKIAAKSLNKAEYQKKNEGEGSQFEMLKRLELSEDFHSILKNLCEEIGILFMSSTFDTNSTSFLADFLRCDLIKVGSGELTNSPLLLDLSRKKVKVILSTGMSTLSEIENALSVLSFGYSASLSEKPSHEAFQKSYNSFLGYNNLKEKVILMHCTSEYPCPPENINLKALLTIREAFKLETGFSDHSMGIHLPLAAVVMGATVIEKHFTLDKNFHGPDHVASLDPKEFKEMVKQIRDFEMALGDGRKVPTNLELENSKFVRKFLVASRDLSAEKILETDDIESIRVESKEGVSPFYFWDFLGKKIQNPIKKHEVITFKNIY